MVENDSHSGEKKSWNLAPCFSFHSPIKQNCCIIGSLKLNLWIGSLKASYNFTEGAWEAKKSLKQPGPRLLKGLMKQNNILKGTQKNWHPM